MSVPTNSLVSKAKKFAVPAGISATLVLAGAFAFGHNPVHAASAPFSAAPIDDNSVSSLVALDNAVEAVAARVTPAVVNVSVDMKNDATVSNESDQDQAGPDDQQGNPQFPSSPYDQFLRRFFQQGPNGMPMDKR